MELNSNYFRNIIFGAEDSLVSTLGVLFGVASATADKTNIIFTGLVVIAVEALSMGAGSFLSETSTQEREQERENNDVTSTPDVKYENSTKSDANPIIAGILMFLSYFVAGFIPLAPYVFIEVNTAKLISVIASLTALFVLGYIPAKSFRGAVRMAIVAGMAILIGFVIAQFFSPHAI